MKLVRRFYSFIVSRFTRLLDRMESPEDKLQNFHAEMNRKLAQLREAVARAIVEEKRMKGELEQLKQKVLTWDQRAIHALTEGKEELAREAVLERQKVEQLGGELHKAWLQQQRAVEELKSRFDTVRTKVGTARAEFQVSLARYKAAEAQHSLAASSNSTDDSSPIRMLDDLNNKIVLLEAETEVGNFFSSNSNESVEAVFKSMEDKRSLDQEVEHLKRRMLTEKPEQSLIDNK